MNSPLQPLFLADWTRALFIHYEVDADVLQRQIPYPLDLHEGTAWVSLVAFHFSRMRLAHWPRITEPLFRPITTTRFLNVRTYVRHRGEPGIFFIREFLSNPMSVPFGAPAFGLPYCSATLEYRDDDKAQLAGRASTGHDEREIRYTGHAMPDGLENAGKRDFLLERYRAFTMRDGHRGSFRIAHDPWHATPVSLEMQDDRLLATTGDWHETARLSGAHFSEGVRDVRMGRFLFCQ